MRRTYAIALVVGAFVASLVQWEMLEALDIRTYMRRVQHAPPVPADADRRSSPLPNLMVGGLLLWVHVQWREGRRSAHAAASAASTSAWRLRSGPRRRACLRCSRASSRSGCSMSWDTCGRFGGAMRARAPRLLDETIITLRHAMPPRTLQSTLARECALLDGQLRLRSVMHPGAAPALHTDIPPDLAHAHLAPLVLWPLVQWLVDVQPAPTTWRLSAQELRSAAGKPRLALRLHSPDARWPSGEGALASLRTRLAGVHGASAVLKAMPESQGVAIELDVALRQVDNRDAESTDR
jgi:hypothetical protein